MNEQMIKSIADYTLNFYIPITALTGAGVYAIFYGIEILRKSSKKNLENKLEEKIQK